MYVTTFILLQYACMIVREYVCNDGHRIKDGYETISYEELGHDLSSMSGHIYSVQ